ncbi:MAG: protein kinase [Planctomycetes bacterium]|nr:protein kinase [Planctomycetota bacterium]
MMQEDSLDRVRRVLGEAVPPGADLFGQIAVRRGFVISETLRSALEEQARLRDAGGAAPRLGQILLTQGVVTVPQVVAVLEEQKQWLRVCRGCTVLYTFRTEPPASALRCLQCGAELSTPADPPDLLRARPGVLPYRMEGDRILFGKYRIVRQIAQGGMGIVYEAEDPDLKRRVALKVLRTTGVQEARRLRREATIAARLSHPNIIAVHEVGTFTEGCEDSPVHFISMDLVEGGTLADSGARSLSDRLRILETVAEAVGFAHSQGVIHRDLKPANVLLAKDGHPVLADFGLARSELERSALTRTGALLGTPLYMAPEQVLGQGERVGPATDVWALGVMLYESLTGATPFRAQNPADLFHKIVDHEPPSPRKRSPGIDAELEIICLRALEKDPRRRYPTGAEFAADLRRHREALPILARPPSAVYRFRKWLRRRRLWVAAALGSILLAAGATWGIWKWERARTFRAHWRSAESARAAGEWERALLECEGGLRIRGGGELERWAQECRGRLALGRAIPPLEERIRDARLYSYIAGDDYVRKLALVEQALADLRRLLESGPQSAEAWTWLGLGFHFVGDLDPAEAALRRAVELDPKRSDAHEALGRLYIERFALELVSNAAYHHVISSRALEEWARKAQDHFRSAVVRSEADGVMVRVAEAYRAFAEKQPLQLRDLCERGERDFGGSMGVEELYLLRSLVESGNAAVDWCSKAITRRPHFPRALLRRGALRLSSNPRAALEDLDHVVRIAPRFADAFANRGRCRLELGEKGAALADLTEAVRLRPDSAKWRFDRACVYESLGDRDRAMGEYGACLRLDPDFAPAYVNRALLLWNANDLSAALSDLDQAVRADPSLSNGYSLRGQLRYTLGDYPGALADFRIVLRMKSHEPKFHLFVGEVFAKQGDREAELEAYSEGIRCHPDSAQAHWGRGKLYANTRKFPEALRDLTRAIELDSGFADAYAARAFVRDSTGDRPGGIEDLTRALRMAPRDWPLRKTAEDALEEWRRSRK